MARKKKPVLRWGIIGVLVLGALYVAKGMFFSEPPAPEYITAAVTRGDIEDTVLASGVFEASQQVSVGAQVSGRVIRLHVALNDEVAAGELVAEIDSLTQQNRLKNAQAALTVALARLEAERASLAQAKLEYERQQRLRQSDASSRAAFEAAEAQFLSIQANIKSLQAQIDQARIDVDSAKLDLGYTQITSPIDGTVVAIVTKEGQTVNANQTAPTIIKVADLSVMTVKAEISEADVVRVHPGQRVYFTILGEPDKKFEAVLREIEPAPESIASESSNSLGSSSSSSAVYYNGLFDIDNPDGKFRIDMTAEVYIVRDEAKDVLQVPSAALQRQGQSRQYYVRVLEDDGTIVNRDVEVGINNRVSVEIVSGLTEGEQVVLGDSSRIDPSTSTRRGMGGPH